MKPVEVKLVINEVKYSVTITHIGEIEELPDGDGYIPIEFHTQPKCPDTEGLHEALTEVVTRALQLAIEEAKQKEKEKDKDR